ncbi:MAG: phytanoyl-CoA dioxygenase family protein [Bacteroidia bacterium]|nr:phytanoyl-CoA dioxygenase family protein [Bacteroidia bacterium]
MENMSKPRIFKNLQTNEDFYKLGYVSFPLFDARTVAELKAFYKENIENNQKGQSKDLFHTTSNTNDRDLIKKVSGFIKPYFEKALEPHLHECNLTISNYLVKESSPKSAVSPHMDWSFVDEDKFTSFNVWVCLDDADYKTGNLQFIPGSHTFARSLRVSPGQPRYFDQIQNDIVPYLVDLPTKAGDCAIFHHSLIHASRRNTSGSPRISCVIAGYPKQAELYHFFWPPGTENNQIEKYKVCNQTYLDLINGERPPHSEFMGHIQFDFSYMPLDEFVAKTKPYLSSWQVLKNRLTNLLIGGSFRN